MVIMGNHVVIRLFGRHGVALLLVVAGLLAAWGPGNPAAAQGSDDYLPPVKATVIDPFRPPATTYGPGNRGLEYLTRPGQAVVAAHHGRVVFAGQIGGSLYLTIRHDDGVRTSYSHLGSISARPGQPVGRGEVIGRTGSRPFHFGARIGIAYVDPALLFGVPGPPRVYLVPLLDVL
jgi:murein DD-endopeptidase MepM/ murein hydrolase activator NlpD